MTQPTPAEDIETDLQPRTVRFPDPLWREIAVAAAKSGSDRAAWIRNACRSRLERDEENDRRRQVGEAAIQGIYLGAGRSYFPDTP